MTNSDTTLWPLLTSYEGAHLGRVALPLGGIGTGTVSLGGRGDLHDFEIVNRPAKDFTPAHAFFALQVTTATGETVARCLEGPLPDALFEGDEGSRAPNHGLPRFRSCRFEAAYPLGVVHLSDPDIPVAVRIEAFNPLIPGDSDASGLPVAVLRYVLTNTTDMTVMASVCGSLANFIGDDGIHALAKHGRNEARDEGDLHGVFFRTDGVDPNAETWGTMALATLTGDASAAVDVSRRTSWATLSWGNSLLDFWDDFSDDGVAEEREGKADRPTASVCARVAIPAGQSRAITFLLTWHFPNRQSWTPTGSPNGDWQGDGCHVGSPAIGNYYTARDADAWAAAVRVAEQLPALEAKTVAFVRALADADLPAVVKEAALFNISTLRTQTVFRTPDGRLFSWEGCRDHHGSCLGSCTHVWNYEQATAFLWADLARTMREVEFRFATHAETGHMQFRVPLPLALSNGDGLAAADGQMGCIMKLYRDWRLSGDDTFLRGLWFQCRKALEFCWVAGGWDADRDGVMEGCQHNTMDVEYYGPNPQMGTWYLGALRAGEEMARYLGETDFADECRRLFENGSRWIDANLFNGEYYEHHVVPPSGADAVAPGLRHASMGAQDLSDPDLQLGAGCLADQMVGQYMAHVCGLGYLLKPENIHAALASVMRYNFRETLWDHFNHLRTFALADEAAVLMASYPLGRRPARPFPYYNEVMTGFEYTAAIGMLQEGMTEGGLQIIGAIRARYDGKRRSPFNEAECGHHYARAMASWAAITTLSGFAFDGVTGEMRFGGAGRHFWSNGSAWGTAEISPDGTARITVGQGTVSLRRFVVAGVGAAVFPDGVTVTEAAPLHWTLTP